MPLLSICIPTYNRSPVLEKFLPCLLEKIKNISEIHLVISDNASTDNTREYLHALQEDFNFDYNRNNENLGPDGNYLKCIELAKGEYTWIIGDDDIITDGIIEKLLNHLRSKIHDYIVVNGGSYSNKKNKIEPRLKITSDIELSDINEYFSKYAWHATWYSVCIFRSKKAKQYSSQKYINSGFVQVDMFLNVFGGKSKYHIIKDIAVYESGNASEYSQRISSVLKLFSDSLWDITNDYANILLSSDAINSFMLGHCDNNNSFKLKTALQFRMKNQGNLFYIIKNYSRLKKITRTPEAWLFASLVPPVAIKLAKKIILH